MRGASRTGKIRHPRSSQLTLLITCFYIFSLNIGSLSEIDIPSDKHPDNNLRTADRDSDAWYKVAEINAETRSSRKMLWSLGPQVQESSETGFKDDNKKVDNQYPWELLESGGATATYQVAQSRLKHSSELRRKFDQVSERKLLQEKVPTGNSTSSNTADENLCFRIGPAWTCHESRFSGGRILELFEPSSPGSIASGAQNCSSYLLLPAENTWQPQTRAVLYAFGLIYCFIGLATITACFMVAMETIVRQTHVKKQWDPVLGCYLEKEERWWNSALADITLLALGTSTPQISLALLDAIQQLGKDSDTGSGLGAGTIVGGVAVNLFPTLAICVLIPKGGSVKRVTKYGVFWVETAWSIWAYVWVLVVLQWSSPATVSIWEAALTVLQMPLLMCHVYAQDKGWVSATWILLLRMITREGEMKDVAEAGSMCSSVQASATLPVRESPSTGGQSHFNRWRTAYMHYRLQAAALSSERVFTYSPTQMADTSKQGVTHSPDISPAGIAKPEPGSSDSSRRGPEPLLLPGPISEENHGGDPPPPQTPSSQVASEKPKAASWSDIFHIWKLQLWCAMSVSGDRGGVPSLRCMALHSVAFSWKILFALLVPPAELAHGWAAFISAIACITGIAAIVIELADLLGCATGANQLVIAITVVATGASMPDVIASIIAASHDATADSALANLNGSNSINVFVGLGVPWLISSLYNHVAEGRPYHMVGGGITFSLFVFFVTFVLFIALLTWRRCAFGGELGGPRRWAWASSVCFLLLWFSYLLFSCLRVNKTI